MKIKAAPRRVASFAPGQTHIVLDRKGHAPRRAEVGEFLRHTFDPAHAPVERFSERFRETMRAKGWLKK